MVAFRNNADDPAPASAWPAGVLPIYVLYDHPKDFPDSIVIRAFLGGTPSSSAFTFPDLEAARAYCREHGLIPIPRSPSDDPVIIETWM